MYLAITSEIKPLWTPSGLMAMKVLSSLVPALPWRGRVFSAAATARVWYEYML
jgi:hypothetical protein